MSKQAVPSMRKYSQVLGRFSSEHGSPVCSSFASVSLACACSSSRLRMKVRPFCSSVALQWPSASWWSASAAREMKKAWHSWQVQTMARGSLRDCMERFFDCDRGMRHLSLPCRCGTDGDWPRRRLAPAVWIFEAWTRSGHSAVSLFMRGASASGGFAAPAVSRQLRPSPGGLDPWRWEPLPPALFRPLLPRDCEHVRMPWPAPAEMASLQARTGPEPLPAFPVWSGGRSSPG
mmetsp:Transcript_27088/g.80727  ORF Transcript_27088/g.80727 Transcript_27088/m.80727 type:complete len:233 (-) Transcript_27088:51-749(-)